MVLLTVPNVFVSFCLPFCIQLSVYLYCERNPLLFPEAKDTDTAIDVGHYTTKVNHSACFLMDDGIVFFRSEIGLKFAIPS